MRYRELLTEVTPPSHGFLEILARTTLNELTSRYPIAGHVRISYVNWSDHDAVAWASNSQVNINRAHWNPKTLVEYQKHWEGLVVDSSPRGVLVHEFGHVLMKAIAAKIGLLEAWEIVYRHAGIENENQPIAAAPVSPYAQENASEFNAETFAAQHEGRCAANYGGKGLAVARALWQELLAAKHNR